MSNKIINVLQISFWCEKTIEEVGPKSGHFKDKFGRKGYGSTDILHEIDFDRLKDLRDCIDRELKKRVE